jgi:glycosyltransferase involved in cell wall biosynthesis
VHYNWSNQNDNAELWTKGGWRDFDIILGNGTLSTLDLPKEAYQKMICAIWSIPNLSNHFTELIRNVPGITWCGIGEDVHQYLKSNYNIDSFPVIGGVNSSDFYPSRKITNIKNIGLNGKPFVNPGWDKIKRPQMLVDIAEGINGNPVFIHDKDLTDGHLMYNDIDMYICTSTNDRGPYGIAEAAFCKIPVLSTKTGLALKFKSIKTFETVDEAVKIINELNSDPNKLNTYIEEVYNEIYENMNWDYVSNKYWIPIFEYHQSLNKR